MSEKIENISAHDIRLIDEWSNGCNILSSRRSYRRYATQLICATGKTLLKTEPEDIVRFFDHFTKGTIASRCMALSAVKSLFSYMHKNGIIDNNPGSNVRLPHERYNTVRYVIQQRDVERMILLEENKRNVAILTVAYSGSLMVSELSRLKWSDVIHHENGGVTLIVSGYRGALRKVAISEHSWKAVAALRGQAKTTDPMFVSKKGGHMSTSAIHRVVKRAALQAGLSDDLSTYWFRHAQTYHDIEAGVDIEDIQFKLGHTNIDTTRRYISTFSEI